MCERCRKRDLEDPFWPALFLDDFAQRLVDPVKGFRHDRQDVPAGFSQHELLRPTLEQRHAEKIFQHDHMTADRALRDRQAVGGGGEAKMLPSRLECSQRIQRQPLPVHPSSARGRLLKKLASLRAR
jgi:hypothetical protein